MDIELHPIGFLHTCWPDRWGVPRQAGLVPEAWGELTLAPEVPGESLRGLEARSATCGCSPCSTP